LNHWTIRQQGQGQTENRAKSGSAAARATQIGGSSAQTAVRARTSMRRANAAKCARRLAPVRTRPRHGHCDQLISWLNHSMRRSPCRSDVPSPSLRS
jgi:hypothetical protein